MWARPEREPGGAGCTHENPGRGALTGGRGVQKGTSEDTNPPSFFSVRLLSGKGVNSFSSLCPCGISFLNSDSWLLLELGFLVAHQEL